MEGKGGGRATGQGKQRRHSVSGTVGCSFHQVSSFGTVGLTLQYSPARRHSLSRTARQLVARSAECRVSNLVTVGVGMESSQRRGGGRGRQRVEEGGGWSGG